VITKIKSNQGVTLLEVVITTVVIGILASLSAPSVMGMLARNDSKSAVQIIQSAIQEVKKEGLRNSKACTISLAYHDYNRADKKGWFTEVRADKKDCVVNADEVDSSAMVVELPENVSFSTSNLPTKDKEKNGEKIKSSRISFNSKGVVISGNDEPAVILVAAKGTSSVECIVVSPLLGLVRTGKYTGTLGDDPYETLKAFAPSTNTELSISDTKRYCQVDI
jgi:prepilin-type N-terminal cleavage/methylation domain-containing protein